MTKGRVRTALASLAAAALMAGIAGTALAQGAPQGPPPQNLRGVIKSVEGTKVTLAERSGETVTINVPENANIGVLVPAKAEDVKQGQFIAITAMPRPDGKLQARVIQFFPPGVRPAPGHRPWDLAPGSTMTNADVDGVVMASGSNEIKVKYQDGEKTVVTGPDTSWVAVAPPDRSQLKPGAQAFAVGAKQPDGSYNLVRISIGKDGLNPGM
jgi:hypothetical protein